MLHLDPWPVKHSYVGFPTQQSTTALPRSRRERQGGDNMTEVRKDRQTEDTVSMTNRQKLKRRHKERSPSSRKDDPLLHSQVHRVTVQGMQVSLPWLSFMARREG